MSRFGDDPRAFFRQVYDAAAPWDVGGPQPVLAALLADHPPRSPILDVGCGSGDLAIHLAQAGHEVVGVDFVETAIASARRKAKALPEGVAARVRFELADASRPSALGFTVGAIVDSGFLHLLDADETTRYVVDLAAALPSHGRYYLQAFATEFDVPHTPRAVTSAELTARFNGHSGWRVLEIRDAEFLNRVGPPVPAIAACLERI